MSWPMANKLQEGLRNAVFDFQVSPHTQYLAAAILQWGRSVGTASGLYHREGMPSLTVLYLLPPRAGVGKVCSIATVCSFTGT
jgi:hypothetical protein